MGHLVENIKNIAANGSPPPIIKNIYKSGVLSGLFVKEFLPLNGQVLQGFGSGTTGSTVKVSGNGGL